MSAKNQVIDVPVESDDIKSYPFPVSNIDDIEPNPIIIALKNKHGEMRKRNSPCVIRFHKFQNLKIQKSITCIYYHYICLGGMRVS